MKTKKEAQKSSAINVERYLAHAVRETAEARENVRQCNYAAAHDALVRRDVWLHAALIAQEAKGER